MKNPFVLKGLLLVSLLSTFFISGCDKEEGTGPAPTTPADTIPPAFSIELTHVAGASAFHLDSTYANGSGESYTPTMFKYYISNIRLVATNDSIYWMPDSYFLVDESNPDSKILEFDSLNTGEFKAIRFIIGVDSARNNSGAQTGALDPANGMFWTWNTGYIFLKLEGNSPAVTAPGNFFEYHIGGFQGAAKAYREVELPFNSDIMTLALNKHPEIHLVADVNKIFNGPPNTISLSTYSTITMPGTNALRIADNFAGMIRYDHMHNE